MKMQIRLSALIICLLVGCVDRQSFPLFKDWEPGTTPDQNGEQADGRGNIGPLDALSLDLDAGLPLSDAQPDLDVPWTDSVETIELPETMDTAEAIDLFETTDEMDLDLVDEEVCTPDCIGRECGNDGCGGSCWLGDSAECDDQNPCTTDSCDLEAQVPICLHDLLEDGPLAECDDGNPCTLDNCSGGECHYPWVETDDLLSLGCVCQEDADCFALENDNLCDGTLVCDKTADVEAVFGICAVDEDTVVEDCPDAAFCNGLETCNPSSGECLAGNPPAEDDGIVCTIEVCNEETDLIDHVPTHIQCDDGNPCTSDSCSPEAEGVDADGCLHAPIVDGPNAACEPPDACSTAGACSDGECVFVPFDCNDNNPCTDDQCQDLGGAPDCQNTANTAPCDDLVECTTNDTCQNALCLGSPQDTLCTDDNLCNGIESCSADSGCLSGEPLQCADTVPCTTDSCDSATGCQHAPDHAQCDDQNPCTDDLCDIVVGCTNMPNALACNDGDPCTTGDACSGGTCAPGVWDDTLCGDYDHDGVVNMNDSCPYAFDPQLLDLDGNGTGDACELLSDANPYKRELTLSQNGGSSTWRRTHEPVELPLVSGVIDASVVGYWPLNAGLGLDESYHGHNGEVGDGVTTEEGLFGDAQGAMTFDGTPHSRVVLPVFSDVDNRSALTMAAWVKPSSVYGLGNVNNGFISRVHGPEEAHSGMVIEEGLLSTAINFDGDFVKLNSSPIPVGQWTHVAQVYDGETLAHYVNGQLAATKSQTFKGFSLNGQKTLSNGNPFTVGCMGDYTNNNVCVANRDFKGAIQDVLIVNRAMSPDEIETWYRSKTRFGTNFFPSAQPDFDDLRVTEKPGAGDPNATGETVKRSRIIGPRPHSDTPCPMDADDGTWADREDLCGVVGYWRLDGDATDVTGIHHGAFGLPPEFDLGRFGDIDGAFSAQQTGSALEVEDSEAFQGQHGTWEFWVRPSDCTNKILVIKNTSDCSNDLTIYLTNECKISVVRDVAGCSFPMSATQDAIAKGVWSHIAVTWNGTAVDTYVNGLHSATLPDTFPVGAAGSPIYLGGNHAEAAEVSVDEFLIHNVAKSPDYIYHRARPVLPKVRFLANTTVGNAGTEETPAYPWRQYTLHWGDALATAAMPFVSSLGTAPEVVPDRCYGLLNGCHGYAGWWRFNEGRGDVVADSSTWKNNGEVSGGASWSVGLSGTCLSLDGDDDLATVSASEALDLSDFTLEAACRPAAYAPVWSNRLVAKGSTVVPDNQNYYLGYDGGGYLNAGFEYGNDLDVHLQHEAASSVGEWHELTARYDLSTLSLWEASQQVAEVSETSVPGTNTAGLTLGADHQGTPDTFWHLFDGLLDEVRLSNRALSPDEFLHYPLASWGMEAGNWAAGCSGVVCPELAGYTATCNLRGFCEYARTDPTEDWHQWDVWVYVPPGSFMMGSEGEGGNVDELPVHQVTIGKGFLMGKYEVVVPQYEACMAADPDGCTPPSVNNYDEGNWGVNATANDRADHPQNGLTWYQAKAVCAWLAVDGRLPSEAEWEYAAGGTASTLYPWGNSPAPNCENNTAVMQKADGTNGCGTGGTWPVGQMVAGIGHFGTLDMAGNLSEWTLDMYHDSYNGAPSDGSPWLAPADPHYVLRSLDFRTQFKGARCAERTNSTPALDRVMYGARCVRPLPGACTPTCDGKACGDDGCGGSCGTCGDGLTCQDGQCKCVPGVSPGTTTAGDNGMVWVDIPAGCFVMGCSEGDMLCSAGELPSHEVTVTAFEILETEVTEAQYEAVIGAAPACNTSTGTGTAKPVDCVDHALAQAFCAAADTDGRLCTEAEWEYATRAGAQTKYPCGNDEACLDAIAWHKDNAGNQRKDVKTRAANAYGLHDMIGNVFEWVEDCYHSDFDLDNDGEADWTVSYPPWSDSCGSARYVKGGAYAYVPSNSSFRVSYRDGNIASSTAEGYIGLRCCR